MADIDDMDDIEDLLEAPYKTLEKAMSVTTDERNQAEEPETNGSERLTNGTNGHTNGDINERESQSNMDTSQAHSNDENKHSTESENNKENSKSSKKGRRDRSRTRSRDRNRKKRSRSRSRSRSKKSKRERSRSKDRERSRDRRRRSSDRDKRSRSRSRHRRRSSRSRDSSRRRHRRSSHSRSPYRRARSPELTPEERDIRTVFCMQLSNRIRPRDLEEFFLPCGKVRDVRLITDPRTKRSKGIAYIEFREVSSVDKAIALTGQRLLGVPIICKLTQAEKNRMPLVIPNQTQAIIPLTGSMKLYIGSLHVNITEDMLKGIFEPFGNIDAIVLCKDDFGRSKGYGYIQFSNADDAKKAMEQLNNFELANRPIKVAPFIEKPSDPGLLANLDNEELDKTGVNLGPSGKLALMAKLAEGTGIIIPKQTLDAISASSKMNEIMTEEKKQYEAPPVVEQQPTQCFLLSNMFDLEEEQGKEGWVDEIREDVIEECSKYGGVVHINIDQVSQEGKIYIKCLNISTAMAAMAGLNGRYFAGKLIRASFIPVSTYNHMFPESVNKTTPLVASS